MAFERVVAEALERFPTRLLGYCVMPNHWHLVLWPVANEVPNLMHWLTLTHATRWHVAHASRSTGPVYQNRYGAIPVQSDVHLLRLLRYVERNPLWAGVNNCHPPPVATWPIPKPEGWAALVNEPQTLGELDAIRSSIRRGRPFGDIDWRRAGARELARDQV